MCRSGVYYYSDEQRKTAEETKERYATAIGRPIVTEIVPAPEFYIAEDYHQQYDAKPNSRQYCGLRWGACVWGMRLLERSGGLRWEAWGGQLGERPLEVDWGVVRDQPEERRERSEMAACGLEAGELGQQTGLIARPPSMAQIRTPRSA